MRGRLGLAGEHIDEHGAPYGDDEHDEDRPNRPRPLTDAQLAALARRAEAKAWPRTTPKAGAA